VNTNNASPETFNYVQGRDWASRIATDLLGDVREALVIAIMDALTSPTLHSRIARLLRDELTERERDLIQQVFSRPENQPD
jgi:hypothetical protein